jgi:hypothetical protein
MNASRLRNGDRRCTKMMVEQTAQVTLADSQPLGEVIHVRVIERTFLNETQRARNRR